VRTELRLGSLTGGPDGRSDYGRIAFLAEYQRPFGAGELVWRSFGGLVESGDSVPVQHLLFAGGPVSAPGYGAHRFAASRLLSQRLEWRLPVPFLPIPLGRWGRIPGQAMVVPLVNAVYVADAWPLRAAAGWYPSVGLGLMAFFDLVRVDVARGLRDGRWTFGIDLARELWRVL
jgi:hypothetical protein